MHTYFQRKSRGGNKRARTRGVLIDSAIEVFSAQGFDAARISDITSGAGLANGTFYNHFRDKDELVIEAVRAVALEIVEDIDDAMADLDDAAERVVTGCARFVSLAVEHADWGRVMLDSMQRFVGGEPDVARFLRADVQRGVDQGLFDIELDDFLIEELVGLVAVCLRRQLQNGADERILSRTTQNMLRLLGFSPAKVARTVERVFRRMGRTP